MKLEVGQNVKVVKALDTYYESFILREGIIEEAETSFMGDYLYLVLLKCGHLDWFWGEELKPLD